jgi:hypothetical protein
MADVRCQMADMIGTTSDITHLTSKSAQRESNPHFRHGKATGCRYIMGAIDATKLSKTYRAPGRTRTGVSALRVRSPSR